MFGAVLEKEECHDSIAALTIIFCMFVDCKMFLVGLDNFFERMEHPVFFPTIGLTLWFIEVARKLQKPSMGLSWKTSLNVVMY